MKNKLIELKSKVVEMGDILYLIIKYQIPISENGYNYLIFQVKNIKTELAELEAELAIECRRKILMN